MAVADKTEKTPRRNAFLKAVRLAKKGFSLCGADGDVQQYQKELAFYDAVRAILAKLEPNSTASSEERQLQLVALLNKAVDASSACQNAKLGACNVEIIQISTR